MRLLHFWEIQEILQANVDLAKFAARAGVNPPGGLIGGTLASSTTISPTFPIHYVSGTEAINTIVPPFTGFVGCLSLIALGAFTLATGGTTGSAIATAVTCVASQVLDLVYDGTLWYPKIMD